MTAGLNKGNLLGYLKTTSPSKSEGGIQVIWTIFLGELFECVAALFILIIIITILNYNK